MNTYQYKSFVPKPTPPDERLLQAAIICYGINISILKMGLISRHIAVNALETVATQYRMGGPVLARGHVKVQRLIIERSSELPLTNLFCQQPGFFTPVVTVKTGPPERYDVSVMPSLRASASFNRVADAVVSD